MQGWERAINTTILTHGMKEEKGKTTGDKKGASS